MGNTYSHTLPSYHSPSLFFMLFVLESQQMWFISWGFTIKQGGKARARTGERAAHSFSVSPAPVISTSWFICLESLFEEAEQTLLPVFSPGGLDTQDTHMHPQFVCFWKHIYFLDWHNNAYGRLTRQQMIELKTPFMGNQKPWQNDQIWFQQDLITLQ